MSKVVHGGNIDELSRKYNLNKEKLIDFSANINPIGSNKNVKMELVRAIDKIERYPDITYFDLTKNNDFIWSSLGRDAKGCRAINNN